MHIPLLFLLTAAISVPAIHVDQVGYPVDAQKVAAVVASEGAKTFTVHRVADGAEVLRGELSAPRLDDQSGDRLRQADFSALTVAGRYEVRVDGAGRSAPFEIGSDPYAGFLRVAMRSYYGQRCGTAVDLGGGFSHPACHTKGEFHATSGRSGSRQASKGWHDAGDYGRYVVNSGITVGTMMWAWELFPAALADVNLAIPESGNATPDVLDEIRWNLEWMLSMQDGDGGVWHKEASGNFPGFVAPQDDPEQIFVIGTGKPPYKSSCATADLAASMAIAARVYRPFDAAFADRALHAAEHAWRWLKVNPDVLFLNPPGVVGGYDDRSCADERLWAAAELWRTARERDAYSYFVAHAGEARRAISVFQPPSWNNVAALGAWTYALSEGGDESLRQELQAASIAAADAIAARAERHPYRIAMTRKDYVWGSNAVDANYAVQLLVANQMRPHSRYVDAALDALHYLLGRNALSLCFVTGAGSKSVMHPHHRPSGGDDVVAPWPGLLAGGPNRNRQDRVLRKMPKNIPPARAYVDDQESYAGNEVAINWNAALVFVTAGARATHPASPAAATPRR